MAGMSRQTAQQIEGTKLKNDVAAAFEHAQHHHLHERQLQEKPVIHHAEEPGQGSKKHDESSMEDESNPEKDEEIHVEVSDRHVHDVEEEKDGYSGDGSHIDVKDLHYHIHRSNHQGKKTLKERKEVDPQDEDGYVEFSGEDSDIKELHVHGKETRDFNSRSSIDDEDAQTPWEHFKMHLHSQGEKDGEFGYITDDDEEDPEENDDESISGERDYDHEHIKTLHVHRRAKHVKNPRDSDAVVGRTEQEITGEEDEEYEDEQSGEDLNSIYERRDLLKSDGENEWEESEGSSISEDEEDETDLSGEEDLPVRDEENIPVDNGRDLDSKTKKARKESKGKGKEKIPKNNKKGPDSQKKNTRRKNKLGNKKQIPKKNLTREKLRKFSSGKKKSSSVDNQVSHQSQKLKVHAEVDLSHQKKTDVSLKDTTGKKKKARPFLHKAQKDQKIRDVESQTGSKNGLNNVEDFYIDEGGEPKQRMFAVEMRDAVEGKDHGEDINPGNRKINKRSASEDGKAEMIQEFRRGNSRHLLQFINMSDPLEPLPGTTTHTTHPEESKGKGKVKISGNYKKGPDSLKKNARRRNKLGINKKQIPKKNIIRENIQKSSSGKKKSSSIDNHVSHQSQRLKVHAEVDLSHQKKTDVSLKDTTGKTKKAKPFFHKARKDQKIRDVESQTGIENGLNNVKDFYIDEGGEPKQRMFAVEMRDVVNGKDHGENINPGIRKINKRSQSEDGKAEKIQEFRRGNSRHLLQFINMSNPLEPFPGPTIHCTHPALADKITDQTIVYIRAECRLCQCKTGELICDAKPEHCDQQLAKPCPMAKGELADGARHFDGCNNCVCRNGELLCTRVRCPSSNYNYTNYRTGAVSKNTLENSLMAILDEGVVRGKDWCMECDSEPVSPVCGPNWKTYRSMCHAFQCGGFGVEDVKQGKCEGLHPCTGVKCAEHEICIVDRRGPCLATTTRDGEIIECSQHQCVSPKETLNCSSTHVEKVCGEDRNNYMNKCEMFGSGVALAYYGLCKEECLTYDARMCGVDGVTFQSICHASLHNSHVDYPGQCDEVDPKNNHFLENSALVGHFNPRCKTVAELARCLGVNCENRVIPEGSCCPICGTAVSIRLDTAARDMICLNDKIQPPQDLSQIDVIFFELKNLSNQFGGLGKCQLTVDLVDTHDVSVVYKPITYQEKDACEQVAVKTVAFINSPAKSDLEPAKALFAAAVIKERPQRIGLPRAESIITKWRMKRHGHQEHEPFFNKSDRIRLQNHVIFLAVVTFVLVYKPNRILN